MDIGGPSGIGGPGHIEPQRKINKAAETEKASDVQASRSADKVEISDQAKQTSGTSQVEHLKELMNDIPDIRADKVAQIRAEIEAGTFETEDRINGAIDRLLDELA